MNRREIVQKILDEIKKKIEHYERVYESARQRSIESEGRNQTRYDTQKVETGYEADAYARKVIEAKMQHAALSNYNRNENHGQVGLGAVARVRITRNGKADEQLFLFVEDNGGVILTEFKISAITSKTPIAAILWGKKSGDVVEWDRGRDHFRYEILEVA
jgi:transcription elongation GreA/GreB family factor